MEIFYAIIIFIILIYSFIFYHASNGEMPALLAPVIVILFFVALGFLGLLYELYLEFITPIIKSIVLPPVMFLIKDVLPFFLLIAAVYYSIKFFEKKKGNKDKYD